jgi:threonine/homoserine/homoserine lactone efflux protein
VSRLLLRGFLLGLAVAASPGPIFFLCFRRTLAQGRLIGLASGLGVATADGFYAAIATFGVAALTTAFIAGRRPLAVIGGVILILLGARILMERRQSAAAAAPVVTARSVAWAYASTLGLTITNPATIVSFAALAATLGFGTGGYAIGPALVVLGVLLGSATWWCILVVGASLLRSRVTPAVVEWISTVSGLAIAVLGILAVISAFSA